MALQIGTLVMGEEGRGRGAPATLVDTTADSLDVTSRLESGEEVFFFF